MVWAFSGVKSLAALVLGFVGLAVLASLTGPVDDGRGVLHFGYLALVPAALSIILAFSTRQVLPSLFLGVVAGGIVYAFGSGVPVWDAAAFPWVKANVIQSFILPGLGSRNYAVILFVYLWCLGGLVGLWGRTGGAHVFARGVSRLVRGPRSAKFATWLLALIFHQGGITSTLLAGTTSRPILDAHPVAKEEAAYLIDTSATGAATLIPFNVWPLYIGGIVAGTIPFFVTNGNPDIAKATAFFFQALPFNFYAILGLGFGLLMAVGWMPLFGPMRKARQRVLATGEKTRPGSKPLAPPELTKDHVHPGYNGGWSDFAVPLAFLLVLAVGPFLVMMSLGKAPTAYVMEAFLAALLSGIVIARLKGMPLRDALDGVMHGAKGVTLAAVILGLAVSLKAVSDALGTGAYVASLLGGVHAGALPAILMLAAMVVAFSTGTSFGTFAVIFPVAMPLADAILPGNPTYLAMCFGAVVGGSIFGDQASPVSDTTVLASVTAGCDLMDHVTTQIPYAILAAALSLGLYVLLGFTLF